MPELRKATLLEIDNDNQPRAGRTAVPVQFNPSSLRLQYNNQSEGGAQAGRQARQYTGSGSSTLTVELVFDTADEGSTAVPRSVLERTQEVEYFIKPQGAGGRNQAPPRLRFQWGNLIVDGVLETLSVDLEHFAHDGTPLRAKAALSVRGQQPEYQFNQVGPGANTAVGATPLAALSASAGLPGALSLGIGGTLSLGVGGGLSLGGGAGLSLGIGGSLALGGVGGSGQVTQALQGETLAALAARNGLPPAAWRALSGGVANPADLPAGQAVHVPAAASVGGGVSSASGAQAGAQASPAQRVGLQDAGGTASPVAAALQRGYALAGAGGMGAALEAVKADAAATGAAQARLAFGTAGGGGSTSPPTTAAETADRSAVFSLRADPRASSFGSGVPLRDQVQVAHDERANLLQGQAAVKRSSTGLPPTTGNPGVPAWVALPLAASTLAAPPHRRGCGCGCGG